MISQLAAAARAALSRRLLGVTAEEIRYTFDDVRNEVRATRAELLEEIADVRRDLDALVGREPKREGEAPADDVRGPRPEASAPGPLASELGARDSLSDATAPRPEV